MGLISVSLLDSSKDLLRITRQDRVSLPLLAKSTPWSRWGQETGLWPTLDNPLYHYNTAMGEIGSIKRTLKLSPSLTA